MGARFSAPVQTGPGAHPASCKMGTVFFPGLKSGRGMTLTPHPLLVPWSKKGTAIPLHDLWAVRPVQSLSACTRVTFTFTLPEMKLRLFQFTYFSIHYSLPSNFRGHSLQLVTALSNELRRNKQAPTILRAVIYYTLIK